MSGSIFVVGNFLVVHGHFVDCFFTKKGARVMIDILIYLFGEAFVLHVYIVICEVWRCPRYSIVAFVLIAFFGHVCLHWCRCVLRFAVCSCCANTFGTFFVSCFESKIDIFQV